MSDPRLEALRAQGAHLRDPARFSYLEVLARRMQAQPMAVRQLLEAKLQAAVADYAQQPGGASPPQARERAAPSSSTNAVSALAELNRYIEARAKVSGDDALHDDSAIASDMKSVRRFSEVWSKISAQQQVAKALQRGPENAGPLNSHQLMLRTLTLMQRLSPDYLRRFLSQMDTMLVLDHANQQATLKDGKPARKTRQKK